MDLQDLFMVDQNLLLTIKIKMIKENRPNLTYKILADKIRMNNIKFRAYKISECSSLQS